MYILSVQHHSVNLQLLAALAALLQCLCCLGSRVPVGLREVEDMQIEGKVTHDAHANGGHGDASTIMDVLFMADIGHSRDHADVLTSPWPMNKSSNEGAYSLYEGLYQYIQEGVAAREKLPSAAFILGDVAYCGGDAECLNATRDDFNKYLQGKVTDVFPIIGNHDVHYLGCTYFDYLSWSNSSQCHYGSARRLTASSYEMTFQTWRNNWLEAFPAARSVILPPPADNPDAPSPWMAPTRYNVDIGPESKVYFIAGLLSGTKVTNWNGDTPEPSVDGSEAQEQECAFLKDSLAHGKWLGKAIFIYLTHHLYEGCDDWSIMQEIDIWFYGHKHNAWQSVRPGVVEKQDGRHYPIRRLLGNGGFDEGHNPVVNFLRMREKHVTGEDGLPVVQLNIEVFDTCRSAQGCEGFAAWSSCWRQCEDVPGGYDGNGKHGPRAALLSEGDRGFTYEAPMPIDAVSEDFSEDKSDAPKTWFGFGRRAFERARQMLADGGSNVWQKFAGKDGNADAVPFRSPRTMWKLRFQDYWLGLGECQPSHIGRARCLLPKVDVDEAATFSLYAAAAVDGGRAHRARLAIWDKLHAPVINKEGYLTQADYGFYEHHQEGLGRMMPAEAYEFEFLKSGASWIAKGVAWRDEASWDEQTSADVILFADNATEIEVHFERVLPVSQ